MCAGRGGACALRSPSPFTPEALLGPVSSEPTLGSAHAWGRRSACGCMFAVLESEVRSGEICKLRGNTDSTNVPKVSSGPGADLPALQWDPRGALQNAPVSGLGNPRGSPDPDGGRGPACRRRRRLRCLSARRSSYSRTRTGNMQPGRPRLGPDTPEVPLSAPGPQGRGRLGLQYPHILVRAQLREDF